MGLTNGMMPASKTLVSEVCGTEHATVGMGLVTCEVFRLQAFTGCAVTPPPRPVMLIVGVNKR